MKNKSSVLISILITVVLLMVVYGVTSAVTRGTSTQNTNATQTAAYYAAREAQYQNLIAQANDTITKANAEIAALQGQNAAAPTTTPYPISADQAAATAVNVTGETPTIVPTLVNYQGTVAYEVTFPDGKVYIDANTGSVLFNGVVAARTLTSSQAAQVAISYTGNNTSVIEVVSGTYNGVSAYRVTFQNGEIVYMNIYGSILGVQPAPASSSVNTENDGGDD